MTAGGALALGAVGDRFGGDPLGLGLFGAYVTTLVLLLATDLDRRILPDALTLPWIPVALVAAVTGATPLVGDALPAAVAVAILLPGALLVASLPFGAGAIGGGDLKLLVSVGLLAGAERTLLGFIAGALLGGLAIGALLIARRISLRSHIPYGPFLIAGATWALLLPA
ncbi:MAG: hypothetical protein RL338_239 [Chloroflexota bacterium]